MYRVDFGDVASAMVQIFLIGVAGFLFVRKKFMDESGLRLLAKLLVNFFWPNYVFFHLTQQFHFQEYPRWWIFPLLSLTITAAGMGIGRALLSFFPWANQRKEIMALVAFQNSGFLPLMLASTIFPAMEAQQLTIYILIFLVGFDLSIWTMGVWFLHGRQEGHFDSKWLLNPPFLAIVMTLLFIALGGQKILPHSLMRATEMLSQCALPMALLTVGGSLAALKVEQVSKRAVLGAVFAKLIVMPLLAFFFIEGLRLEFWMGFLILLQSVVPSAITLSILARHYKGIDEQFINQGLLFSHILSLLTIPAFLSWYLHVRLG